MSEDNTLWIIHTANISGNLHDAATFINKAGWAEYLVTMSTTSGCNTIAVFKMPARMVYHIREENPNYASEPDHDFPDFKVIPYSSRTT